MQPMQTLRLKWREQMKQIKAGSLRFLVLVVGLLVSRATFAEEPWPIAFLDVLKMEKPAPVQEADQPGMSQPEFFDPAHYKSVKDIPEDANFQSVTALWKNSKTFSLKEYYFDTDDEPSYVLEISKGGKRHALYTQVAQYEYSPDNRTLVLENQVKQPNGKWVVMNRIIDVASKKAAELPSLDCTTFYEQATNTHVITYGHATTKTGDSAGPPRTVCIWDHRGKLQNALTVPLQNWLANTEASSNSAGLLPGDETIFYQLAYMDKHCILRLQNLSQPQEHRAILLPSGTYDKDDEKAMASGEIGDPCLNGAAVDIDLEHLAFKKGNLRFRVSKSGRGDLQKDWLDWQTFN